MLSLSNRPVDIAFCYAPGKVILVGEHAVLYGARAIAVPIDAGVRVAVYQLQNHQIGMGPMIRGIGPFLMGEVNLREASQGPKILKNALDYLVDAFGEKLKDVAVVVDGSLPPGRGLGSSASFSVSLIKGIFRYFAWPCSESTLLTHVEALETIFHGSPSGIDHSVVIKEEVIGFRKGPSGADIWPIKLKSSLKFLVGMLGPHDGTKNAVMELRERKKRHEKAYARIFLGLDEIAEEMESLLVTGEHAGVGELMNIAQGYLNALSLSTPEIERLCAIARDRGALGAKLTGAGGGGAIIALIDGNEAALQAAFKAAGYQSFVAKVFNDKKDFISHADHIEPLVR